MCSLKNAYMSKKSEVIVQKGKMVLPVLKKIAQLNFIKFFKPLPSGDIKVFLDTNHPRIETLKFFNTGMGFKSYKVTQVIKAQRGYGSLIFTTSQGIKANQECIKEKIGGLPLFYIN